jgi:hypothetical protein
MILAGGLDWGNVPQWVSGILSSLSLLVAFYIILRERRKDESEQARKVLAWLRTEPVDSPLRIPIPVWDLGGARYGELVTSSVIKIHIYNSSNAHVAALEAFVLPTSTSSFGDWVLRRFLNGGSKGDVDKQILSGAVGITGLDEEGFLAPGRSASLSYPAQVGRFDLWLRFSDGNGRVWQRRVSDGKLVRAKDPTHVGPMGRLGAGSLLLVLLPLSYLGMMLATPFRTLSDRRYAKRELKTKRADLPGTGSNSRPD